MVERFEDLAAWKSAQQSGKNLYLLIKRLPDQIIRSQLIRAALSMPLNIAEGFERWSKKEFVRFLRISLGSASEVKAILIFVAELKMVDQNELEELLNEVEHTKAIIKKLISSIHLSEMNEA